MSYFLKMLDNSFEHKLNAMPHETHFFDFSCLPRLSFECYNPYLVGVYECLQMVVITYHTTQKVNTFQAILLRL